MVSFESEEAERFRQRLLSNPGERAEVEYKAALPFGSDDDFTLKLVRHVIGMANNGGDPGVRDLLQAETARAADHRWLFAHHLQQEVGPGRDTRQTSSDRPDERS